MESAALWIGSDEPLLHLVTRNRPRANRVIGCASRSVFDVHDA